MCNRARMSNEPEKLFTHFGAGWAEPWPVSNRAEPRELRPKEPAWIVRRDERGLGVDLMTWDVLGGAAAWSMTNVRQLGLPQWRRLAADPANRCLVPLTEFCE